MLEEPQFHLNDAEILSADIFKTIKDCNIEPE